MEKFGFTVSFDIDNDSFKVNPEGETARTLRELADKIEAGRTFGKVMDINGNTIGSWEFVG